MKAQALADLLEEFPTTEKPQHITKKRVAQTYLQEGKMTCWTLYTDGASRKEVSGAGMLLKIPTSEEITYALHFDFQSSNNEAEHEALLAGMLLVKEMEAEMVEVLSNFMLATNQINGLYEVRYGRMSKCVKAVKHLAGTFKHITVKKVLRSENKQANMLRKLASTSFEHLTKKRYLSKSFMKEAMTVKKSSR